MILFCMGLFTVDVFMVFLFDQPLAQYLDSLSFGAALRAYLDSLLFYQPLADFFMISFYLSFRLRFAHICILGRLHF